MLVWVYVEEEGEGRSGGGGVPQFRPALVQQFLIFLPSQPHIVTSNNSIFGMQGTLGRHQVSCVTGALVRVCLS